VIAALLTLAPYLAAAFFPAWFRARVRAMPGWAQLVAPGLLAVPYVLVTASAGGFAWAWFWLYASMPVAMAAVMCLAYMPDQENEPVWPRLVVLALLGLAVDLRWFERAWPAHLAVFNKVLLMDAGLYAFAALRPIAGAGFDLRLRWRDVTAGLREVALYLPIALPLGLGLGFLHWHGVGAGALHIAAQLGGAWVLTFSFIAVPEELYFRGWLQNLVERKLGRTWALVVVSVLFGLSHFNKRTRYFNWRYVLLAAIAGVFYGRAWRRKRRVGASAVTHSTVDAVWSVFLR
jgi:hypothetical protein